LANLEDECEYGHPIQPRKDEWGYYKKQRDEQIALSFFSELTAKTSKVFEVMNWKERKPRTMVDTHVRDQYKKFFSEDFGSYDPGFINISDDGYVDYVDL